MPADPPIAIQLKTTYLAPSETFIHRHLSRLLRWRPHVFAERLLHLDRFPLPYVERLPLQPAALRAGYALLRRFARDETLRPAFRANDALRRALAGARLLHAHFGEAGVAALSIRRACGLPLVTSFHGRDVAKPAARRYGRLLYRGLFRAGAAFTVVSRHMRGQLIALGAPAERVHLIRTGVDPSEIAFVPRAPAPAGVRLITIGRLVEKKGTRDAIEALARLRDSFPDLTLTIVGDGPLRGMLERQARRLGVAGRVRFCGALAPAQALAELMQAQICALPCVTAADGDQEGAPVVLMEALASGMPVVSTLHAGVPEIVEHGVSGYLAPEGDAAAFAALLARLLGEPERWPAMGGAGRRRIEAEFDLCAAAADLERLYDRVSVAL
jgi:glycosyltransferase involved in cell wall biosynthesis